MQVVEFPSDVVDASEDVQLALEELHRVAIPFRRDVSLVLHAAELEVGHVELPQVLHPLLCVLASEHVHILAVSGCRASAPWRWDAACVTCTNTIGGFRAWEESADFVFGDVVLEDRVQVVCVLAVISAYHYDLLFFLAGQIHAPE